MGTIYKDPHSIIKGRCTIDTYLFNAIRWFMVKGETQSTPLGTGPRAWVRGAWPVLWCLIDCPWGAPFVAYLLR